MSWTEQKLRKYLGRTRLVVEFEGVTGEELERALHDEAVLRLEEIRAVLWDDNLTDGEKLRLLSKQLE